MIFYSITRSSLLANQLLIFYWSLPSWQMAHSAAINHLVGQFNDLCVSAKVAAAIKTRTVHTLYPFHFIMKNGPKKWGKIRPTNILWYRRKNQMCRYQKPAKMRRYPFLLFRVGGKVLTNIVHELNSLTPPAELALTVLHRCVICI